MYRIKIAASIAAMLIFVFILGVTLYFGAQQSDYYFQRSEISNEVLIRHLRLSVETDRFFHEQLSLATLSDYKVPPTESPSYARMIKALAQLRVAVEKEINYVDQDEHDEALLERDGVNYLSSLVEEGVALSLKAYDLNKANKNEEALTVMEQAFFRIINNQFWPLIDIAIEEERNEVEIASKNELETIKQLRFIALTVSAIAIVFAIVTAILLYRSLSRPLEELLDGTDKISAGNLSHRLSNKNRDEFGYLSTQFNQMAASLEQNREALINARDNLEEEVNHRTQELQLANKKLRDIDESRSQFFAEISHELRTPLTIIRGEAEVTLRGEEKSSEEYTSTLNRIIDLSKQMGMLVGDLLYLARARTANMHYEPEELVLNDLIKACYRDTQSLIQEKSISTELQLCNEEIYIQGDSQRLKQLFHILADNACKYSKKRGKIKFVLTFEEQYAVVKVIDSGIGISAAELDNIFERFYRTKQAKKTSNQGTGLGLSLAKTIAEVHQGSIEAESQQGVGTTMTVKLPLATESN